MKYMKKIVLLFLLFSVLALFQGCFVEHRHDNGLHLGNDKDKGKHSEEKHEDKH